MKIKSNLLHKQEPKVALAQDYKPPFTLGNPPEDVQVTLDKCFSPVETLLDHSLSELGAEGIPSFVGYGVLTGLAQNGLIRAGVEMRAKEMTRAWGELVREGNDKPQNADEQNDQLKQLEQDIRKFKIQKMFNKAAQYCGYYGGVLVFIDTGEDANSLANPLTISKETFSEGSLKGLRLVEPFTVSPGFYNSTNPISANYFKPSLWYVQGIPVHASRFLYFAENELPTLIRPAYNFFGLSLAQKVLDAVSHYTGCRESSARLLKKYAVTIFKTNMQDVLSGGFDNELQNRVTYFNQMRDNDGTAVIDKEAEDLVVMTTSLAGVTDLVRQAMEYVAAMFNEPVTKMWGLSPNGFNTGDSDLSNHYDNIESLQEDMFGEPMAKLVKILQMNAFGEIDESIHFEFAPLDKDDETATVTNNKTKAETDTILMEAGIIAPEEARQRLIDEPNSGYNNLTPYDSIKAPTDPLEPFNPDDAPELEGERKEEVIV